MENQKRKYCKWQEEELRLALRAYRDKTMGLNEVCRVYGIPKPTFKRHLLSKNLHANEEKQYLGRCCVFSEEMEQQLVNQILRLEASFFGITITDVRKAAFEFAESNRLKHNFNKESRTAGKKWFYKFMNRHPELSLKQHESTSIARYKGFNKKNVLEFFNMLERIVDEQGITPTKIFNVDVSGFATVQKRFPKILARGKSSQIGSIASGESDVNTTLVVCVSAAGQYTAPMIIFKRKRMDPELVHRAPSGCLVEISDTGYINSDLFVQWLKHFIDAVKPSLHDKVLLILDGHTTHSKNLPAMQLAHENDVILLQLPGDTTHRLQPLDLTIFRPLEHYYGQAIEQWLRGYPGIVVTQFQVAQLVAQAYDRAASISNAVSGFRQCGVWPVNNRVFGDAGFEVGTIHLQEMLEPETDHPIMPSTRSDANDGGDLPPALLFSKPTTPGNVSIEILPLPDINKPGPSRQSGKGAQKAQYLSITPPTEELEVKGSVVKDAKRKSGRSEVNMQSEIVDHSKEAKQKKKEIDKTDLR